MQLTGIQYITPTPVLTFTLKRMDIKLFGSMKYDCDGDPLVPNELLVEQA
jgi:hypothetical protein